MLKLFLELPQSLEANTMTVRHTIICEFEEVARRQAKKLGPLSDNLVLLDSGLDSLCFAIIVARLEDTLGIDPFSTEEQVDFPVTLGDFIRFYENAAR
jgi:acyl carrier protein